MKKCWEVIMKYWKVIVWVLVIAGISTLIPVPVAKAKKALIGYKAHCPAAPISTLICFGIILALSWVRNRKIKEKKESNEVKE